MTKAELVQLIQAECGTIVAEVVKEQFAKSPANGLTAEMVARLQGAGKEEERSAPRQRDKGLPAARITLATAATQLQKKPLDAVPDILKSWGDHDLAKEMTDYQAKAQLAGEPTAGGILIPPTFSTDLIELLRPASIVRSMNPMMVPMPTGTVRIPKVTAGSTATYVGESVNIPASELAFGQVVLTWKKLTALVPISNDLIRYATIGSPESIVRDDMVRSIATRENLAFLRDPGNANVPRGLLWHSLPANRVATAGTWVAQLGNAMADLANAILTLQNLNIPLTRPGWLMSPSHKMRLSILTTGTGQYVFRDELNRGTLWGYPYAVSTHVPAAAGAAELYFADFADVVIGDSMRLAVDTSMEASYFDGTQLQSAFSLDQSVIRAISEHDLGVRRQESISVITGGTV